MTTLGIETEANTGLIANADFNIGSCLRRSIIPEFFDGVGNPGWRRRTAVVSAAAGDNGFDLPRDFVNMEGIYPNPNPCPGSAKGMTFIGDDPAKLAAAKSNTTPASPSGYFLEYTASADPLDPKKPRYFQRVGLTAPLPSPYTLVAVYYMQIPFDDDTTEVDLSQYIPEHFQYALVYGLRRDIFIDRHGQGDNRAQAAAAKFNEGIINAKRGDMELARVHRPRFWR